MSNAIDYAYVAGIIDGEGCIAVRNSRPAAKNGATWCLTIRVHVCSKKIVDKLVGVFGGHIYLHMPSNHQNYPQYYWSIRSGAAYKLLRKIKPYLTEKKAQADIGIQFFNHQKRCKRGRLGLSPVVIKKRESMHKRLKELKTAFLMPIELAETKRKDTVMGEAIVQSS